MCQHNRELGTGTSPRHTRALPSQGWHAMGSRAAAAGTQPACHPQPGVFSNHTAMRMPTIDNHRSA